MERLAGSAMVCTLTPVCTLYSSRKTGAVVHEQAARPVGEGHETPSPTRSSSSEVVWKRHAEAPAALAAEPPAAQEVQLVWPTPA